MLVIGDVHGCYTTLLALLDKLPSDDVCFLGDLIDRGPDSRKVVELVRENNWHCVRGNHEDMAIDEQLRDKTFGRPGLWTMNGGLKTLKNYQFDQDLLKEHIEWFNKLPLYLDFPDLRDNRGRGLFVSHSGLYPINMNIDQYDINKHATEPLSHREYFNSVLWYRGIPARVKERFHVFGHTPREKAEITGYYANVDTGCVYNRKGYRYLTALQYPSMLTFTQLNIENQ